MWELLAEGCRWRERKPAVKEGNWSQEHSVEEKGRDRSEKGSQLNGRLVIRTQETVCDTNRIRREGGGVVGGSKRQLAKTAEI